MKRGIVCLGVLGAMGVASVASVSAQAAVIVAAGNQEVLVPVNAELGAVLQFSLPVKTVTPAKNFSVTDLGSEVTATGAKSDVRTFQVKPAMAGASENVTFVLAGGRTVNMRLVATQGGEKFFDVALEAKRALVATKFLSAELELMRAMIGDELGGFSREVMDTKVSADVGKLDVRLTRTYASADFTGYVFKIANEGSATLDVSASEFAIGKPNRAVMTHVSKSKLESCPMFSVKPNCTAMVHVVVRGMKESPAALALSLKPAPFVKSESNVQGGSQ